MSLADDFLSMRRRQLLKTTAVGLSASALGAIAPRPASAEEDLRSLSYGETKESMIDSDDPDQLPGYYGHNYEPFYFTGKRGDEIEARMESRDFQPVLLLYHPRGHLIEEATDGAPVTHTFEISTTYTLRALAAPEGSTGSYTISLFETGSGGGGGSEREDLRSLSYGETKESKVDSDDPTSNPAHRPFYNEPINFIGKSDDDMGVRVETRDFHPFLLLYNPRGDLVGSASSDEASLSRSDEPEAPSTGSDIKEVTFEKKLYLNGPYRLRVVATPERTTGSYTISLFETGSGGGPFTGGVVDARDQIANATVRVYTTRDGELIHETITNTAGWFSFTQSEVEDIDDAGPVTVVIVGNRWFDSWSLAGGSFSSNDGSEWSLSNELLYGPTIAHADVSPLGQVSVWRQVIDSESQTICMEVTNTSITGEVTDIDSAAYDLTSGNYNLSYDEDEIKISKEPYTDIDHPQEMQVLSVDTPATSTNDLLDLYHPERTGVPMSTVGPVEYSELDTTDGEERINEGAGRIAGTLPYFGKTLALIDHLEWAIGDRMSKSASLGSGDPEPINPNERDTAKHVWQSDDIDYEEASVVGYFPIRLNTSGSATIDVRGEWKFEPWTRFGTGRGYFAEQFELDPI